VVKEQGLSTCEELVATREELSPGRSLLVVAFRSMSSIGRDAAASWLVWISRSRWSQACLVVALSLLVGRPWSVNIAAFGLRRLVEVRLA
jgi:hypothetical protein